MKSHIRRCPEDDTYTMQETCPVCGSATRSVHPPRFSTVDRFEKYRKQVRQSRK